MTTMIAAGIDVGRDSLDIAILPSGRSFRVPNVAQGIAVLVDRLQRAGVVRVVLESIGSYGQRPVRALAPHSDESGTRKDNAHIAGGRPCVRAALYMAALVGGALGPLFKSRYRAMRDAGKPAKVALARHLLTALNTMIAQNRPWTTTP